MADNIIQVEMGPCIVNFMCHLGLRLTPGHGIVEVIGSPEVMRDIHCYIPGLSGHAFSQHGPFHRPRLNIVELCFLEQRIAVDPIIIIFKYLKSQTVLKALIVNFRHQHTVEELTQHVYSHLPWELPACVVDSPRKSF